MEKFHVKLHAFNWLFKSAWPKVEMRKKRKKIGKISCESANKTIITKELWPIYSIPTRTRYYSSVFYNGVFLFGGGCWLVCLYFGGGGGFDFCFPPSLLSFYCLCCIFVVSHLQRISRRFNICNFLWWLRESLVAVWKVLGGDH